MVMESLCLIYTTISSQDKAEKLAEQAVSQKLAACVNIIPEALSVYEWEGKIEKSQECLMLFKTENSKADKLQAWILTHHTYSPPAILKGEVKTSADFYKYVRTTLK